MMVTITKIIMVRMMMMKRDIRRRRGEAKEESS